MVTQATKKKGVMYVRRSTVDQENSLATQLEWALLKSRLNEVELDASQEDLSFAIAQGFFHYKSLFIDNGVSGTDRSRRGLNELQSVVKRDRSITHLFVHRPDRLGRDDALYITKLETEIRQLGVTIVYFGNEKQQLGRDGAGLGDVLTSIVEHHSSRQWLETHAERIVEAQLRGAQLGHWQGGNAPYGFKRVLVGSDGKVIEALSRGRRVQEKGCHVEIVPGDETEIKVLHMIFGWANEGFGAKAIANKLNELGIPSPAAGQKRKDNRTEHFVSGVWNHTTVLDLINNKKLKGVLEFGKQSEGIVRRFSPTGPRKLEDSDYGPSQKLKNVRNDASQIVCVPGSYNPLILEEDWERANKQLELRGKSQRGVPKNIDPNKNLLACRIIDLHNGCGHPLYSKGVANSRCYACGRYMKTDGIECRHNKIDADEVEGLSLDAVRQLVLNQVGRHGLAEMLKEVANERRSQQDNGNSIENANRELKAIEQNIDRVKSRLVNEVDDELCLAYREQFDALKIQRHELKTKLESISANQNAVPQAASDVEQCMMLLDNLDLISSHPEARKRLNSFFRQIAIRLGIDFETQVKGKTRNVQVPTSGLLRLNNEELPVPFYGKDNAEN